MLFAFFVGLPFSFGRLLGWPVAVCLQIAPNELPPHEQITAEADKDWAAISSSDTKRSSQGSSPMSADKGTADISQLGRYLRFWHKADVNRRPDECPLPGEERTSIIGTVANDRNEADLKPLEDKRPTKCE